MLSGLGGRAPEDCCVSACKVHSVLAVLYEKEKYESMIHFLYYDCVLKRRQLFS